MWPTVLNVLFSVLCVIGVLMTSVRLPGTWLIVVSAAGLAWWTKWQDITVSLTLTLTAIAATAEIVEFFMSMIIARRAGASRRAGWSGLAGGILGMLFLSFLFPIPLIGTIFGALLGCFGGALIAELSMRRKVHKSVQVGFWSAIGFALGSAAKTMIAMVMVAIVLIAVWS